MDFSSSDVKHRRDLKAAPSQKIMVVYADIWKLLVMPKRSIHTNCTEDERKNEDEDEDEDDDEDG